MDWEIAALQALKENKRGLAWYIVQDLSDEELTVARTTVDALQDIVRQQFEYVQARRDEKVL